jgi:hypothetical protein
MVRLKSSTIILDSLKHVQAGRSHKSSSHNCMSKSVGKRQKIIYINEKRKSFYAM